VQTARPPDGWKKPAPQLTQLAPPLYMPGWQEAQDPALGPLTWPAGHDVHAAGNPPGEKKPPAQLAQLPLLCR